MKSIANTFYSGTGNEELDDFTDFQSAQLPSDTSSSVNVEINLEQMSINSEILLNNQNHSAFDSFSCVMKNSDNLKTFEGAQHTASDNKLDENWIKHDDISLADVQFKSSAPSDLNIFDADGFVREADSGTYIVFSHFL